MEIDDFERAIVDKSRRDPEFAEQLTHSPHTAIENAFDITLPDDIKLEIIQQDSDTLYFVIPPASDQTDDHQLTHFDLWNAGEMFHWLTPITAKFSMLNLRKQFQNKGKSNG